MSKKKKTPGTISFPAPSVEETQPSPSLAGTTAPIVPFSEFLRKKSILPITIAMDDYREQLREKSKNIIWKDGLLKSATEAAKLAVEIDLKHLGYPMTDLLLLSLETGNPNKIQREYKRFREWWIGPVPTSMVQAETVVQGLGGVRVDELVESLIAGTELNMRKIQKMLELALSKIKWNGSQLIVKPEPNDWFRAVEGAEVRVSREPAATKFRLCLLPGGLEVGTIAEHDEIFYRDIRLQEDYFTLLKALHKPSGSLPKIMTLYLTTPVTERHALKEAMKELAVLGTASIFTNKLSSMREETFDKDVWKIRVDGRRLIEIAPGEYQPLDNDNLIIRSIELIQEGDI